MLWISLSSRWTRVSGFSWNSIFQHPVAWHFKQSMYVFPSIMQQLAYSYLSLTWDTTCFGPHGHPQVSGTVKTATLHLRASNLHTYYYRIN
jgi:hypothetical protein